MIRNPAPGAPGRACRMVFLTIPALATIRPRSIETAIRARQDLPEGRGAFVNCKGNAMSRRCDLTGKGVLVGHKVSHSNIKTKRRFLPNLLNVTMISDTLGRSVRLRVSANALKTVDHRGGLDAYLMGAKNDVLAPKMRDLKKAIAKKQAKAS
jgi:large subunit ribosomal protein L28